MGKKNNKKYYAIIEGRKSDLVVESWEECAKLTQGCKSKFKGFSTMAEAKSYLKEASDKIIEKNYEQESYFNLENMSYGRKRRVTFKVGTILDKETYIKFIEKCKLLEMDEEKAIMLLVQEWVI
jgi:viroplasmin and RNaseH domain-containing protein